MKLVNFFYIQNYVFQIDVSVLQRTEYFEKKPPDQNLFWGAESKFEIKIASYPISVGYNLKKRYFRIYFRLRISSRWIQ